MPVTSSMLKKAPVKTSADADAEILANLTAGAGGSGSGSRHSSTSHHHQPDIQVIPSPPHQEDDESTFTFGIGHVETREEREQRVTQQSQSSQHAPLIQTLNRPVKKKERVKPRTTLFGATCAFSCQVNDEVRLSIWILLLVMGIAALAFFIADVYAHSVQFADLAWNERGIAIIVGGLFSGVACILTWIQIRQHYNNWTHPQSQRCVVRILLMVPIYAISAWFSLVFVKFSLYIDFVRGCYEAFVIYTFTLLLTKYLGGHAGVVECFQYKPALKWPSPLCCLKPVQPNDKFLYYLKYGTLQYAISQPVSSLIALCLNLFDVYGDGEIDFERGYVYVAFIQNCTQLVSLYCLVWLYVCLKNELNPFKPMPKFLVVKAVVFFTFWQSVGIAILVHISVLKGNRELSVGEIQIGLQDFLVCIEMFIAAAVHKYTFGYETYADGSMKLLMESRAMFLAEQSYKRAAEAILKKEKAAQMRQERSMDGSNPLAMAMANLGSEEENVVEEDDAVAKERLKQALEELKVASIEAVREADDSDDEGALLFDEKVGMRLPGHKQVIIQVQDIEEQLALEEALKQVKERKAQREKLLASVVAPTTTPATTTTITTATTVATSSPPQHTSSEDEDDHKREESISTSQQDDQVEESQSRVEESQSLVDVDEDENDVDARAPPHELP